MRVFLSLVLTLLFFVHASQAHAARFTDEALVRSLTINQNGTLLIQLRTQQCPGALSVLDVGDAPGVFGLIMQAILHKRKVRITSDTITSGCKVAAVELL